MKKSLIGVAALVLLASGISFASVRNCSSGALTVDVSGMSDTANENKTAEEKEADANGYIVKVGDMAPDFSVELTDGRKVKLSELRGKVVMLQFTASWCGVCRKEMPHIEKEIWQRHKDNDEFFLIGVDRDEPLDKVIKFGKSTGVTYPLGLDPGAEIYVKYALRESGITRNVLIDKDGRIVMLTRLFKEDEFSALVKKIDDMLK